MIYDAIIIGDGPAGISAALYTVRANIKTLVLGLGDSVLRKASKIENYYGFSEPVSGEWIISEGEKQLKRLGGEILKEEVIGIEKEDNFHVKTVNNTYTARTVLIATGQKQANIKIRNLKKFEGRGISYCTTCDGFFYRGKKVGVLGFKDFALHEANELLNFTKNVTVFTNGEKTEFTETSMLDKFEINEKPIAAFEGGEVLEKIVFEDGSEFPLDGMFIAYGTASSVNFALKMGILTREQSIIVNERQETNIPGLFAAGDCTGVFKQIAVAVGQGAIAGRSMIEYVRSQRES
ncbi:thioredoxin reductase TrxB [Thermoclostridium stercorarium subsp. stercorarium DSM 8532]|uniref:Thioredoxin reductase TrxB n=1 Tax=Thermoclostridium stercorarium (strain ATCC 35414 / DSM 8532 / NCIMB 11754) TaxID=1121335 RepID=L7VV76_THES1|nr:NAD(P)/FAD-dependent oxidoreductase [Thermoclostridium stercorarium]AGC69493.1 thioredoxin reductase TrxB [Thermoclostridium stercorarium subsp. stercorarium DSM 8532]AGI40446.1 thioredoxin reductase [Thermoclostridium stercorarium subsp. stercorarium DSM 8532]UZQ85438.1 NAD(P)/FAD-dependent oxidoreductase [Thermoclostridium stercorarium]